ncbi:MAG TPA: hypothetical protein DDW30_00235 [Clostridiales bacterium]|nr:hypothetical protein [Clostridiales bacterium]
MYQSKELYILDFSGINRIGDIHRIIRDELDFPDYYGMNWDACWDCLTDMVGKPLHIKLIGVERIRQKFPRHAEILLELFKELKHYDEDCKAQIKVEIVIGEAQYEIE